MYNVIQRAIEIPILAQRVEFEKNCDVASNEYKINQHDIPAVIAER